MKTVKIRCFSAMNGEKTFAWNGLGEWIESAAVRFETDGDRYHVAWTPSGVRFRRIGELPLELDLKREGTSLARITADGQVLEASCVVTRIQINDSRVDVFYRMEGLQDTHRIHLDWTLEGRN
jgi:hypothetical protein